MKKIIAFSFSLLFLFATSVCFSKTTLPSVQSAQIQTKTYKKFQIKPRRTIDIKYSVLTTNSPSANNLNKRIHKKIKRDVRQFMKVSAHPVKDFPSKLLMHDKVLFYKPKKLISIRYNKFSYYAGQAHPTTTYSSINFDLASDKELHLKDILQNPNQGLQKISQYAMKQLKTRNLEPKSFLQQGAAPKFENYQTWNFTQKGLLITFSSFQVAARVFGAQTVVIPYAVLKSQIKPKYYQLLN